MRVVVAVLALGVETRAFRIKLKAGSLERVRQWAEEITRRKDEALETLKDESVVLEHFFLQREDGNDYLFAVMTAESFERSLVAVQASEHAIDALHQAFKRDTWESVESLELLVGLNRLASDSVSP